jgi:hypothetical protein
MPSPVKFASNIEAQQAQMEKDKHNMRSELKAKVKAGAQQMDDEEKLRYGKLRDLKKKLVSRIQVGAAGPSSAGSSSSGPSSAGPSSATRKYGRRSINIPLSHIHTGTKPLRPYVSHQSWANLED